MSPHLGSEDKALKFFTARQDLHTCRAEPRSHTWELVNTKSAEDEKRPFSLFQLDITSRCNDVVRQSGMLVQSGILQLLISGTSFLILH